MSVDSAFDRRVRTLLAGSGHGPFHVQTVAPDPVPVNGSASGGVTLLDLEGPGLTPELALRWAVAPESAPVLVVGDAGSELLARRLLSAGVYEWLPREGLFPLLLGRAVRFASRRVVRERQGARMRSRQELAARTLDHLSNPPPTTITSSHFGVSSLRQDGPGAFREMVAHYRLLLDMAVEERAYRVKHELREELRVLARQLGQGRAGPRDVVELHARALEEALADVGAERGEALADEARLLVLELMGHLVSHYRMQAMGSGQGRQGEPRGRKETAE